MLSPRDDQSELIPPISSGSRIQRALLKNQSASSRYRAIISRLIVAYEGNKSQGELLHRGLTNCGSVHRDVARKKSQIRAREAWRFISDGALVSREASRGVALANDARS
jgi:hypothetical protein